MKTQRTQRTQREQVSLTAHGGRTALAISVWAVAFVAFVSFVAAPAGRLAAGSQSGAARNGTIRGRVELRRVAPPVERRPTVSELGTPAAHDLSSRLRSVVYLESAPRGAFEQSPPGHAVLDQRDEQFVPHVLAIMTGTTVDFPNSDRIYHNVFSLSKAARFDLGRYAVGHSKAVRFEQPGIVRVFCDIHSHMNAFILVFSHPFFAVTDEEGRYRIENVPPGAYGVVAWNEGVSSEPTATTVPDGGASELDFTLR